MAVLEWHSVDGLGGAVGHDDGAARAVCPAPPALALLHRQHGRPLRGNGLYIQVKEVANTTRQSSVKGKQNIGIHGR